MTYFLFKKFKRRNITIDSRNVRIGEIWYLARLGRRPVEVSKSSKMQGLMRLLHDFDTPWLEWLYIQWQSIKESVSSILLIKFGDELFSSSFSKVYFTLIEKVMRYLNSASKSLFVLKCKRIL